VRRARPRKAPAWWLLAAWCTLLLGLLLLHGCTGLRQAERGIEQQVVTHQDLFPNPS